MKIIFLDIDGVLVNWAYSAPFEKGGFKFTFDPRSRDLLEAFLVKHPDVKIVLSSTWRKSTRGHERIKSQSPLIYSRVIDMTDDTFNARRYLEIENYLSQKPHTDFVILDDEPMEGKLALKAVKTYHTYGLREPHIEEMEKLLYGTAI